MRGNMELFKEITVKTTHEGSELIADILSEYSSEGVFIEDKEDVKYLENLGKTWDYIDDKAVFCESFVTVKGYVKENDENAVKEISERLKKLKKECPFGLGELSVAVSDLDGDLWKEKWKENFKPIKFGKITVVPAWMEYKPEKGELPVYIGSDMAFGTGEHETTALCIEKLQKYVTAGSVVLDVGTGSGILGIAAARLNAKKVVMTDIDECSVKAAKDNLELNGVKNAEVYLKNLLDDNTVKGDIIVANIMAEILISFADGIKNNLSDDAVVILSGILTDREDKVIAAYKKQGFTLIEKEERGEWSVVVLRWEKR